jgi:hypothetical protein
MSYMKTELLYGSRCLTCAAEHNSVHIFLFRCTEGHSAENGNTKNDGRGMEVKRWGKWALILESSSMYNVNCYLVTFTVRIVLWVDSFFIHWFSTSGGYVLLNEI